MSLFKNFDWSAKSIAKVVGVVLLGIIALSVAASLVNMSFRTVFQSGNYATDYGKGGGIMNADYAMSESYDSMGRAMAPASYYYPTPSFSTGDDAESFEVTTYNGSIKTRKLDETCGIITALKTRPDVIFEDSNKNDDYCYYRFKVKKENAEAIVKIIEDLEPEVFNVSVQSIKSQVESVDDELSILQNKLDSIEETLSNAQDAYDEISQLATRQQDAETLAKVIDSKLNLIERLSSQKLEVKEQIDRYNEAKSNQLDQLNYTFFNIDVAKDLIFDWKEIKDTWKFEAKEMVRNLNGVIQAISLNLVTYLARFGQAILYFFIAVFLLKFVWIGTKRIWVGKHKR